MIYYISVKKEVKSRKVVYLRRFQIEGLHHIILILDL